MSSLLPATGEAPQTPTGSVLSEVSRTVVSLYKKHFGKGPVKAHATLARDVLTVVMEGGLTTAEHTLADHGSALEVRAARLAMHGVVEEEFRKAVETLLYRGVRSVMSASDPENDLETQVYILNPEGADELSATESRAQAPR
jgi:uncharacterized protein YbcI